MKIYKNAIIVTSLVTLISFFASFTFNFYIQIDSFWCNALLGVFGSSLLTLLTSLLDIRLSDAKLLRDFIVPQRKYCISSISIRYHGT